MPDESLDILVRYGADLSGQQQALAGQQELTDSVKAGNKVNEEGAEKLKLFDFHGKEARKTMHLLSEALPGAGIAARAAFNPENIGLVGTVALLEIGVGWLKKWREHQEEMIKLQGQLKKDGIEGLIKGAIDAAAATAKYREELRKAAEDHDALKRKEDEMLATLNEQLKVREQLLERQGVSKDTAGNLSDRAKIEQLWGFMKQDAQARSEAEQQFNEASRNRAIVQPALDATINKLTSSLADIETKLAKATEEQSRARGATQNRTPEGIREAMDKLGVQQDPAAELARQQQLFLADTLEKANKKVLDLTIAYERTSKSVAAESAAKERLATAQDEAANLVKKYGEQFKQHEAELDKAHAALAAKLTAQAQIGLNDAGFKDTPQLEKFFRYIQLEQFRGKGGVLQQDEANQVKDLQRSLTQQNGGNSSLALQIIKDMQNSDKTVAELLQEILHYLGYKDSQILSMRLNNPR